MAFSNTLPPPPPPPPPAFREDTREEGNLADVDSSSTSSSLTSTSDSGSESDRSHDDDTASSVGGPVCNLTLSEITKHFYATKTDDEPVLKPSFLRNNRKSVRNDSGQSVDDEANKNNGNAMSSLYLHRFSICHGKQVTLV